MIATTKHTGFTGRHMLLVMVGFFLTVFAANMTMVYFASKSWTGLVVKNAYVASQEFDATTKRLVEAAARIHAQLQHDDGRLVARLTDADGKTVYADWLVVHLGRPSHEGEDQDIVLQAAGDGSYMAPVRLEKGQWVGTVSGSIPQHQNWQRPVRILVKG
jgi:nitrogen fixation protein FixH